MNLLEEFHEHEDEVEFIDKALVRRGYEYYTYETAHEVKTLITWRPDSPSVTKHFKYLDVMFFFIEVCQLCSAELARYRDVC